MLICLQDKILGELPGVDPASVDKSMTIPRPRTLQSSRDRALRSQRSHSGLTGDTDSLNRSRRSEEGSPARMSGMDRAFKLPSTDTTPAPSTQQSRRVSQELEESPVSVRRAPLLRDDSESINFAMTSPHRTSPESTDVEKAEE